MVMNEDVRPKVVFLDTNALHFIYLYLEHARNQRLYPFTPKEDAVAEAKKNLRAVGEANLKKSLEKGLAAVDYLSKPDVRVEYSSVSELELIVGRARGKAVESAAKEGIPDRMWTHFYDKEISARLTTADLTDIRTRVEGLGPTLERAGILAARERRRSYKRCVGLGKGHRRAGLLGVRRQRHLRECGLSRKWTA